MSIFKGSRYEYSKIDFRPTKLNGPQNPIVFYSVAKLGLMPYTEHVYMQGERLDQLTAHYYKNPYSWWVIPEANPEIVDFSNIPAGTILRIPSV